MDDVRGGVVERVGMVVVVMVWVSLLAGAQLQMGSLKPGTLKQ
jgi:hypothetical protein